MSLLPGEYIIMLKKELCIKCWKNTCFWNNEDEWIWKEGWINCPLRYTRIGETTNRKIINKPPTKCPFILEHILSNEDK